MCSFSGGRVRHEYVTMHITFLTRKSALICRRGLRQRVASLTLDCNGVFAIRAYRLTFTDREAFVVIHNLFNLISCPVAMSRPLLLLS